MPNKATEGLKYSFFTENLCYLLEKSQLSAVALAEKTGVSAELIGKLRRGKLANPSLKVIMGISKHFDIPMEYLVFRDLEKEGIISSTEATFTKVPILGWEDISHWKSYQAKEFLMVNNTLGKDNFAVYLTQDYGPFHSGGYIIVNTKMEPKHNGYVLIINKVTKSLNLRKIIVEDKLYLQSIVPGINEVTSFDENINNIIGFITAYQKCDLFINPFSDTISPEDKPWYK